MFTKPSQRDKTVAFLAGICTGLILLGIILFTVPSLRDRVSWRVDFAMVFIRGIIHPVRPMPTAVIGQLEATDITGLSPTVEALRPTTTPTVSQTPPVENTVSVTATVTSTPAPTLTPTPIPEKAFLAPPSYEKQDLNNCGPATLAMHLRYFGWQGTQSTISDLIKPKREDRNVNVEELVAYVHTEVPGIEIIYRVGGDIEVLKRLLAAGFPVTIEEAFIMQESYWPNDDRWAGHYLLLTGYDDSSQKFTAQDVYVGPNIVVSYQVLDQNWKAFNRVYIVTYTYDQQALLENVLGDMWDADKNRQHALDISQEEIDTDSTDSYAWFNLGTNLVYFEKYSQAAIAYDNARENKLPQRMLRYQFGPFFAYFHTNRIEDLLVLTEYALERTPTSEEAMLWRGWGMYREGDIVEAESLFMKALEARPGYSDAQYGLDFIRNN